MVIKMKLKDSWKLIILVVLAIIGSLLIYYNTQVKNNITSDEKKFKEEYESHYYVQTYRFLLRNI